MVSLFTNEFGSYKYMIFSMIKRELRGRYKGSIVGFLWNYIFPIAQVLVYYLVFSNILKSSIEWYSAYLVTALIPWFFFSESVCEGSGSFVSYSELVKKNYFPRYIIPLITVSSKLVNFIIAYILGIVILLLLRYQLPFSAILLPFVIILFYFFILGLTFALSAINVYLRDVQYITNVLMIVLIWLSPIMYMKDFISDSTLQMIIDYNPITCYINIFHELAYYGSYPDFNTWGLAILWSTLFMALGWAVLKKSEKRLAELL